MKKVSALVIIALFAITSVSCSKSEETAVVVTPPTTTNGFSWTDSSSTTVKTVDNPYATAQFKTIFAVRSGVTIYEINLTSLAVGTYPLTATGANSLFYNNTAAATSFSPTSGSVIITANANNKLTGTFTATGTGAGVSSVNGSFTNITINP
jgi:hypothetical protein